MNRRVFLLTPAALTLACKTVSAGVCRVTADNIEGPFFKADAPSRADLVPKDARGERIAIKGCVQTTACKPIAGARLEFWQADHRGAYDNQGFDFRGTLTTDARGRYEVRTIVPGRYLNGSQYRPAHIHVKVAAKGHAPLTTQLYFDGDPYNDVDPWIRAPLIMKLSKAGVATFDFVLA